MHLICSSFKNEMQSVEAISILHAYDKSSKRKNLLEKDISRYARKVHLTSAAVGIFLRLPHSIFER